MTKPRLLRTLAMLVPLLLLLTACPGDDQPEVDDEPQVEPPERVEDEPDVPEDVEPVTVTVSSLGFPSLVAVLPPLIQEHGIDANHGINLEINSFADIGGFYAAKAQGAVDGGVGGPTVFQGLVAEGADLQIVASYVGLRPLVLVTADPDIESITDLEGRSLAATVGSAEFQVLAMYASSEGIDLTQDTTLVNASLPDVRTQLEAGRVDAGMFWEPAASLGLTANEDWRVILNGDDAWTELTGEKGWELVWALQRSFIQQNPEVVDRFIAMLQEAVEFLFANPEEAGRVMEEATGMPADAFVAVLNEGRLDYDVQPAWDPEIRSNIQTMLEMSVEHGFSDQLPPDDFIYEPDA
jgi:NitT/TauT family transport system substrate-binding protein